jgi:hypothetical protein
MTECVSYISTEFVIECIKHRSVEFHSVSSVMSADGSINFRYFSQSVSQSLSQSVSQSVSQLVNLKSFSVLDRAHAVLVLAARSSAAWHTRN